MLIVFYYYKYANGHSNYNHSHKSAAKEKEKAPEKSPPKPAKVSPNTPKVNKVEKKLINLEETTRVKSHLLDHLMSYSEELVQIRNSLTDIAEHQEEQRITELSNRLSSVSENILNDLNKS